MENVYAASANLPTMKRFGSVLARLCLERGLVGMLLLTPMLGAGPATSWTQDALETGAMVFLGARTARAATELPSIWPQNEHAEVHEIGFFPAASDSLRRQGFARVINRSGESGTVMIDAYDDAGVHYGPLTLSIGANRTVYFNSGDLEKGRAEKGAPAGYGAGGGELAAAAELDPRPQGAFLLSHFRRVYHEYARRRPRDLDRALGGDIQFREEQSPSEPAADYQPRRTERRGRDRGHRRRGRFAGQRGGAPVGRARCCRAPSPPGNWSPGKVRG